MTKIFHMSRVKKKSPPGAWKKNWETILTFWKKPWPKWTRAKIPRSWEKVE